MSIRHAYIVKPFGCFRVTRYGFDRPPSIVRAAVSRCKVDPLYTGVETNVRKEVVCFGIALEVLQHSGYS